jgi:hypothetical protein
MTRIDEIDAKRSVSSRKVYQRSIFRPDTYIRAFRDVQRILRGLIRSQHRLPLTVRNAIKFTRKNRHDYCREHSKERIRIGFGPSEETRIPRYLFSALLWLGVLCCAFLGFGFFVDRNLPFDPDIQVLLGLLFWCVAVWIGCMPLTLRVLGLG